MARNRPFLPPKMWDRENPDRPKKITDMSYLTLEKLNRRRRFRQMQTDPEIAGIYFKELAKLRKPKPKKKKRKKKSNIIITPDGKRTFSPEWKAKMSATRKNLPNKLEIHAKMMKGKRDAALRRRGLTPFIEQVKKGDMPWTTHNRNTSEE